ncbi:MAG: hypothetical protein FJ110_10380 [Deltaproteobacteria bacterium]|nr:hypothetical protein [Deltaproteobacteria bacterium]
MALKRREKILLVVVLVAVAIFLFDRLFDTPMNRKISMLKGEVKAADSKLAELALLSKGLETAEAEIIRLEEELKGLSERTLRGEEFRAFLRHLARESDPLQMKVISISPSEEKISPSEEKKESVLQDSRKVAVHLVLHSTFAKLESYLKGIEELPFLVQIEGLQIQRNDEIQPLLKVTLGLKMYIIAL